jgi:hypothetical protein
MLTLEPLAFVSSTENETVPLASVPETSVTTSEAGPSLS